MKKDKLYIVITSKIPKDIKKLIPKDSYLIACDGALSELQKEGIIPDMVIGDFDSLGNKSLLDSLEKITLPEKKDISDTHYAVSYAYKKTNNVLILGGLKGNRIDHLYANILLLQNFPNLIIKDNHNKLFILNKGTHNICSFNYDYISFFAIKESLISLNGFKYPLNNYLLKEKDPLGLSNKQLKKDASIIIKKGKILVIMSSD